ncbi:MAG: hypothetical protein H8E60_05865 [Candidatus Marinimicrobia bacterium]|nr:hypothetical protein [Candidatus Neomarinimicrobiota bacterium]
MKNNFNLELANQLGADDYGMKKYTIAFLKKGPNRNLSEEDATRLQRTHLDNIHKMVENGTLILAGPFLDDGEIRGIYIFNIDSVEKAQKIAESDPAIKAGSLSLEIHPWYGSASLMKVNEIHNQIAKIKI